MVWTKAGQSYPTVAYPTLACGRHRPHSQAYGRRVAMAEMGRTRASPVGDREARSSACRSYPKSTELIAIKIAEVGAVECLRPL
jgi:hypothetical protein